ncbi:MAG: SPOR domain-containing protein [Treponema sp.]|nr:SPOR domain-containing protein [Treponema sp.]
MKKLLLVAVSVGVFLLVSVTAAIVIITPKVHTEETAFSASRQITVGKPAAVPETVIPAQPTPVINVPENGYTNGTEISTPAINVDRNDGERLTITVPKPTTAAVPDVSAAPAAASTVAIAPAKPVVTSAPAAQKPAASAVETKPAAKAQPAPKTTPAAKPAAAAKPAPVQKPATPAKTIHDYWVQTGAFRAKVSAEGVKETLASKGITSIIENREINGETLYRVRVGPYTSEKEANYWLALVKTIDGFGESQVRQSVR